MDTRAGTPLTPSYTRDPSAATTTNPSTGSFRFASAGAPLSTDFARNLFMPPRMTTAAGGVASAPAVKPRAPPLEAPKCGAAEEGQDSLFASLYILRSFNDEAYMSTMGVGFNNSHWSQNNGMHFDDHEFEVDEDDEGIVDAPKGRGGNYTNDEDVLLCNTWLQVSRDPSVGGDQSRDAYWNRKKEHFDLHDKIQYCTKLVQKRGEEEQERKDQERKTIFLTLL
ncbi:putative receptor protein kinase ZmPK1 [Hordeum vulgare]|nr:putative receptor protein kinase ZmPK1 [Hordeum vulgare]